MKLKWNKQMIGSNILIAGLTIKNGRDRIIISITHSDSHEEDEYPGLVTLRRGDRHNELFTHHFVAHGLTDEEVFTDAEEQIMKVLNEEIKKYNDASKMIAEAMNGGTVYEDLGG